MPDVINAGDKALATKTEGSNLSIQSLDMGDFKEIKSQQSPNDSTKPLLDGLSSDDELLKQIFSEGIPQDKETQEAVKQVIAADKNMDAVLNPSSNTGSAEDQAAAFQAAADARVTARENLGDTLVATGNVSLASGAYESALKAEGVGVTLTSPEVGKDLYDKLDKLGVTPQEAQDDITDKVLINQLDSSDDNLRRLYIYGAPTQADERAALNEIVNADQAMASLQISVATGSADDISSQLQQAANDQISSREALGDTAAKLGDGLSAIAAYTSALKMQLNNAFASPTEGNELYDKLAQFGISKADAIASVVGDAEDPNQ